MKLAIINDQHFGVRNDSLAFLDFQEKFYNDVFFPTILKAGIDTILDLGDTFDRRKYINFYTLDKSKSMYFDHIKNHNIRLHSITGNHTTYYKNTNELNSIGLLLKEYTNISVYQNDPVELTFGSTQFLMVPWITKSNYQVCMDAINTTSAQVLLGHFEIAGFEMMRGHLCDHGLDKGIFKKFDAVYSGHFHHPSEYDNIKYLGAPYEMNWTDYEGKRGFHILDTETRELEFIQNPYSMFHKIFYNDNNMTVEEISNLDISGLTNTVIKVIIQNKENPYIFDIFMDQLQQSGAADIKIVEDHMHMDELGAEDLIDEAQDTHTILTNYIDTLETKVNKDKIKAAVTELYQEAMNL